MGGGPAAPGGRGSERRGLRGRGVGARAIRRLAGIQRLRGFVRQDILVQPLAAGDPERTVEDLLLQDPGYGRMPFLVEFRFTKSACHLHIGSSKDKVSSGSGYGFDRAGVALAGGFCKEFAAELKAIFDQWKPKG